MRMFTVLAMVGLLAVPRPQAAVMQSSASVEWAVEIYESPTSAPPPDVAGPQGKKLFAGTLRAPLGQELRQFIPVGNQGKNASQVRGISILLSSKPADAGFETRLTVDTNLPFGQYDQKKDPVWLRAHTTWSAAAGAKEFITESTLASTIAPTVAPATTSTEPSIAREAAGVAADAGVDAAAARIPGGSYIPSVGGLFNRNSTPQPRKTVLLFVVTTSPVAQPAGVRTPR